MKFKTRTIKNLSGLIKALRDHFVPGRQTWYRGQADSTWSLTPSLARNPDWAEAELSLLKKFKQNAITHAGTTNTDWGWLFLMQHHRLPTRLLDWTEHPLVGLFFAVEGKQHHTTEGTLWCLDPVSLNAHANISYSFPHELPAFEDDQILNSYLPTKILQEKTSDLNPVAGIAYRNSPRIVAQMGTFTITHRRHTPIESIADRKHIWRYNIPPLIKEELIEELALLRVNRLSLFPELDEVADAAKGILS